MEEIGLALGGGAVLGAAHVGVLRAINELDINIKYVSGTSIGAVVATFYAFGKSWEELNEISASLNWNDITGLSLSRYGLLSNAKLREFVVKNIGDKNIEDADIPLAMVATNIVTGDKVCLTKGSVADAIMASTCVPGIFKPIEINGNLLVDGGIVENVPITTARDIGAKYVIGVDLNSKHNYRKPHNIFDVIMNSFHFLMKQTVKRQTDDADLLISPDLAKFNRSDIKKIKELIEKGYIDSIQVLKDSFTENAENL